MLVISCWIIFYFFVRVWNNFFNSSSSSNHL